MPFRGLIFGQILALGVLAVAAILAHRQWCERRTRPRDLTAADDRHFVRQDRRRFLGAVLMALIAVGIVVGVRIEHPLNAESRRFLARTWLAVSLALLLLLSVAFFDWIANRIYANRHRRALIRERRKAIEAELGRRNVPRNGRGPRDHDIL